MGLLLFSAIIALSGACALFWYFWHAWGLGPFHDMVPDQYTWTEPFPYFRQVTWGIAILGVGFAVAAFVMRHRWKDSPGSRGDARQQMAVVLEAVKTLLARPGNDFAWSPWKNADEPLAELDALLASLARDEVPDYPRLMTLFAANGPIQNVSVSSGWTPQFVALADRFDTLAARL